MRQPRQNAGTFGQGVGELDQRISVEDRSEINDGGTLKVSHNPVGRIWAKVISQKGSEAFESARVNAKEVIRVKVRYRKDITTSCRCEWMGNFYEISAVDHSQRRGGWLWFTAVYKGKK